MIQLSLAIQHALHYPLLMSSLTALNIAFFLLSCLILACAGVSLFITFIIYIQIVAYETRVRNRLHIPNTINMSSEAEDDGSGLNVQVLERLSPSVTINEDDKHELNSSECPICLEEYWVGESCRRFPNHVPNLEFLSVPNPQSFVPIVSPHASHYGDSSLVNSDPVIESARALDSVSFEGLVHSDASADSSSSPHNSCVPQTEITDCSQPACASVSLFITFVIYIQIIAYEARVRDRLHIPNTINVSSEVEDDGLVLERLSPSVTINEDDKNELNSSECPICLEEYVVGESCRHFPERKEYVIIKSVPNEPGTNSPRASKDKFEKHLDDMLDVGCLVLATITLKLQKQLEYVVSYEMIQNLKEIFEGRARQ
ncbi:hypothetical protein V6N11_009930 [Hibiscus sabdariffa]|uniref:RING-type E3 ubiquitin transferase n=1 Tax=Hibiscus sabdariffa TaxID=183260 RepID=A0ABR2PDX0_9ROSI